MAPLKMSGCGGTIFLCNEFVQWGISSYTPRVNEVLQHTIIFDIHNNLILGVGSNF